VHQQFRNEDEKEETRAKDEYNAEEEYDNDMVSK